MPDTDRKNTVLLVEDDEHIRTLLIFMLEREGLDVLEALDGQQAVSMIGSEAPPALAVLDIMLPYVDGYELIRTIRRTPSWKEVPIIMLTTRSNDKDVVKGLDVGANDYVRKPFNPDDLMARVRQVLH